MESCIVRIEFMRVQTFLFAVPRLADIIGANALLGETLRYALPEWAREQGCSAPAPLPSHLLPDSMRDDPLAAAANEQAGCALRDSPCSQWSQGILARDGGHFSAFFAEETQAEAFIREARFLLRERLPGLRFELDRIRVADLDKEKGEREKSGADPADAPIALFSLPVLQQCQEAGNGPASYGQRYRRERDPARREEERWIGLPARQRKDSWQRFKSGQTRDIASLMGRILQLPKIETFEQLCGDEYLALLHADGNGLGKLQAAIAERCKGLEREARIEAFFHRMRTTMRRALQKAAENLQADQRQGLQILMLGGDDLLVACRASLALPFARHLADALDEIQRGAEAPLTLGIGVAIAKPAFPFHRLHEIAEELASSAKRLARGLEKPVSVVDWTVCSEAWQGDSQDLRRSSQWLRHAANGQTESLALSAKPYRVLSAAGAPVWSLADLLQKRERFLKQDGDYARSQLRELARLMRKGRRQSDSAYLDLQIASPATWRALQDAGFAAGSLWRELEEGKGRWLSHFADFVESLEIEWKTRCALANSSQPAPNSARRSGWRTKNSTKPCASPAA
jgi:hypothetical protein